MSQVLYMSHDLYFDMMETWEACFRALLIINGQKCSVSLNASPIENIKSQWRKTEIFFMLFVFQIFIWKIAMIKIFMGSNTWAILKSRYTDQ